jgi:hypothetical protein
VGSRVWAVLLLQGNSARLLGTDRVGQATAELNLDERELVNDAVIKYSR